MSTVVETSGPSGLPNDAVGAMRRDTLAASVVFLIGLSCIQPVVTLVRGVVFCRWLTPAALGSWDLALSFLTLAAPVVVFGIPGSFGRYVEHYSQKGQLAMFLRRTTAACAVLAGIAVLFVVSLAPSFSQLIFGASDQTHLVVLVGMCLATMIAFGFVVELLTALRMFRVVSILQFVKGVSFAVAGAGLLLIWQCGPESLILGYAAACLLAVVLSLFWLVPVWRSARQSAADRSRGDTSGSMRANALWSKLLPFAVWVWIGNFLSNLFEVVDRTMIVHASGMSSEDALIQVGYYHSSRIVPVLFVTFACMLASVILPHLTKDWEAGRRDLVSDRMNLCLKMCALVLAGGATAVMLVAPWLFDVGFQGKYSGGLAVLPWTLTYCVWFGMSFLAEMYLWCAERARLASVALAIGVVVNIGLNVVLLPRYGLLGAVLATAASKLLLLVLTYVFGHSLGLRFDLRTWLLTLLPLSVVLGAETAAALLAVVGLALVATPLILAESEKEELSDVIVPAWHRVRVKLLGGE